MENTNGKLTIKGFNKVYTTIFTKLVNGQDLTEKQQTQLNNFIKDIGGYREEIQQESPQQETEQPKQDISLGNWKQLTAEQRESLKESLIKSKYGIGGEHLSTFPTLLDNTINTWVEKEYNISKLPKRVTEQTFQSWAGNGEIKILPMEIGKHIQYLILLLPNKDITLDIWELEKEGQKPFLKYTSHKKAGQITLTNKHFHILNIYSNKNKAFNQSKQLTKLFQLNGNKETLEQQKELQQGYISKDIKDGDIIIQEYTKAHNKGKQYKSLGEYLGREQHKEITINYLEHIQ